MKLWGGRFIGEESEVMEQFNTSLQFDKKLYYEDIIGSIAHVKMLTKCKILTEEEKKILIDGLQKVLEEIETGKLQIEGKYEDIHSFIEIILIQKVGEVGKKLHTARSRNDQVAVDMKLYARKIGLKVIEGLDILQETLWKVAEENPYLMPGYTHLQRAQVITFGHHMKAYYHMLYRDKKRVRNALDIMNESPLGCCALAGTTYNIDREFTAEELGFSKPVENFLDGVSDRDYIIELLSAFSIIMMHLSRLSEELILWSTKEFDFIQLSDAYTTGSSIMPQKKNPDAAELIRGKTGRAYGNLMSMLTTMKGLPLAYNKDMQEDKEPFFDSAETVLLCMEVMHEMLSTLEVKSKSMLQSVKKGFLNATEVADYLVQKGMAFRDAHGVVGQIVLYCEEKNICIEDVSLKEFQSFSDLFGEDIYSFIEYENILRKGIKNKI